MSTSEYQELVVHLKVFVGDYEKSLKKASKANQSFTDSVKVAAGVLMRDFVTSLTQSVTSSIKLGAQLKTLEKSFRMLSAATGEDTSSLKELRAATEGMVSDIDLLTQANAALALGLPTEDLDELFAASIKLGKAMGLDATHAVESLTMGIGRKSRLILDNLGIVVRAEEAYEQYANVLGKSTDALTTAEKSHAFQSLAIQRVRDKAALLGDNISENEKGMERWSAAMKNLTTGLGSMLSPLAVLTPVLETLSPAIGILLVNNMGKMKLAIGGMVTSLQTLTGTTISWGAVTTFVTKAVTVAFTSIPFVGWATAAIIALGFLIKVMQGKAQAAKDMAKAEAEVAAAEGERQRASADLLTTQQELAALEAERLGTAQQNENAIQRVTDLTNAYNDALERQTEAEERVEEAQTAFSDAVDGTTDALNDISAVLRYVQGSTDELVVSWDDLTWASEGARLVFDQITETMAELQGALDETTAEYNRLSGAIEDNTDLTAENNAEIARIKDEIKDAADKVAESLRDEIELREELKERVGDYRDEISILKEEYRGQIASVNDQIRVEQELADGRKRGWRDEKDAFKDRAKTAKRKQEDDKTALKVAKAHLQNTLRNTQGLTTAQKTVLQRRIANLDEELVAVDETYKATMRAIEDETDAVDKKIKADDEALRQLVENADEEIETLENTRDTHLDAKEELISGIEEEIEAKNRQIESLKEAGKATDEQRIKLRDLASANRDLAIDNTELGKKLDTVGDKMDSQKPAVTELKDQLNLLSDADDRVEDAHKDLETASDSLKDAKNSLTDATDRVTESFDELEIAERKQEELADLIVEQDKIIITSKGEVEKAVDDEIKAWERLGTAKERVKELEDQPSPIKKAAQEVAKDTSNVVNAMGGFVNDIITSPIISPPTFAQRRNPALGVFPPGTEWSGDYFKDIGMGWEDYDGQQHGGRFEVRRPSMFVAGEGGPETVTVTRGVEARQEEGQGGLTVNFHVGTFVGLNSEAARTIAESTAGHLMIELERKGIRP